MPFFVLLIFVMLPSVSSAAVLTADTVWEGMISVEEDVVVPEGITLTVRPGTFVAVSPAESTKTDPEYLSPLTEITVRGTLKIEGTKESPVVVRVIGGPAPGWAGIIIDGGAGSFASCVIENAETGIHVINGALTAKSAMIRKNRYGIVAQGARAVVTLSAVVIEENDYGLLTLNNATVNPGESVIRRNSKQDRYAYRVKEYSEAKPVTDGEGKSEVAREYGNEVLQGDTVWQGTVRVSGIVRVPASGRLIIMPGAVVEFTRKDTNGDGVGEHGFLIQGVLIAKGTPEKPIIFRSAERMPRQGDWDAINIMNSDGARNLVEHCRFEDAYRGLHFHFSNVLVQDCVFKNNYRGIQFQESLAEISRNRFYGNKNGIQARDSDVVFLGNALSDNYTGANFFRTVLTARGNSIRNNHREGLRVREGVPVVERNLIDGNRYGLLILDALYGNFSGNVISNNGESGLSVKGSDTIEVSGNYISRNGITGVSVQDTRASVKGNTISGNGVRGIGILSFDGVIMENNIVRNGRYALEVEGTADVSAPLNWWGGAGIDETVFDKEDDPAKGKAAYAPVRERPIIFLWPLETVSSDSMWHGIVQVATDVLVAAGATLTVTPGTEVLLSKGAGLKIQGTVHAPGTKDERIVFTALVSPSPGGWNEIFLDHAGPSAFSFTDFEGATWAIHSHFTNLTVSGCRFRKNYGGIRFRSGPVEIRRTVFEGNSIGVRAYRGSAIIEENSITGNDIGIFVREKGGGLMIKRNNIFGNSDYGMRLGDFNDEDVRAPENYWGPEGPGSAIFDGRQEPGIGLVLSEPAARKPHAFGGNER